MSNEIAASEDCSNGAYTIIVGGWNEYVKLRDITISVEDCIKQLESENLNKNIINTTDIQSKNGVDLTIEVYQLENPDFYYIGVDYNQLINIDESFHGSDSSYNFDYYKVFKIRWNTTQEAVDGVFDPYEEMLENEELILNLVQSLEIDLN
ncbi:MAG: hypothetical protein Q9M91_07160 [Candidatus Dojkabacteria bacterium]|nr:hypothetical protein [Candidatus Dojkabacteria bacterium]MDQ7021570.1 hypothetical protein [Candidatus Dojkabacteria bacterium]